ncbi:MAG: hypothetical protein M1816_001504 [Peltula sp. TS41687]|nr:MAG: hypothetical protein M1816_001504 [Peltula sp. TS41687]
MPRRGRAAATAAARAARAATRASLRTPSPPQAEQISDEEMVDAPASGPVTPHEANDDETSVHNTPSQSGNPSEPSTPVATPSGRGAKKRLGRPPKNKPVDWDSARDSAKLLANDAASESGTPFKRRRGRPSMGVGRWGKPRGGPSHVSQVPVDKEGNQLEVVDDEVVLPIDPEGETKVDKDGRLQGGRQYRCRTFTILGKGERLYMLSTEPARCMGFRDSYLFFQKHKLLYKIIVEEQTKRDMIDRSLIPHSYKGRIIGVVTARSVFREFGARIVVGGKKIQDDYQVAAARANGDVEGELADPQDRLPRVGERYNQNQYVAWHGASSVYHSGMPTIPTPSGKAQVKKVVVTDDNWMLEHAFEASRFNSSLALSRRKNLNGVYEPHTNAWQYPKTMQPTHARWEKVDHQNGSDAQPSTDTLFPVLAPAYTRHLLITDTYFVTPPPSIPGVPGPEGEMPDVESIGLSVVDDDLLSDLPMECLREFKTARDQELEWKGRWRGEAVDGWRRQPRVGH